MAINSQDTSVKVWPPSCTERSIMTVRATSLKSGLSRNRVSSLTEDFGSVEYFVSLCWGVEGVYKRRTHSSSG